MLTRITVLLSLLPAACWAQFTTTASHVRPVATLPTTCKVTSGDVVFLKAPDGPNLVGIYHCASANTWAYSSSGAPGPQGPAGNDGAPGSQGPPGVQGLPGTGVNSGTTNPTTCTHGDLFSNTTDNLVYQCYDTSNHWQAVGYAIGPGLEVVAGQLGVSSTTVLYKAAAQAGAYNWCDTTGSTSTAYLCALMPVTTGYATGQVIRMIAPVTAGVAPTVAVGALAAKPVYTSAGLAAGSSDIVSGRVYEMTYDGTHFVLGNGSVGIAGVAATFSASATTGTITHNFATANHIDQCVNTSNQEVLPTTITLGANGDSFTFSPGLAADTTCTAIVGGSGGSPSGGGTVTASGSPAIHQVSVFTTGSDIKGITVPASGTLLQGVAASDPTFTATPTLGVAGATVGTLGFANATSGSVTLQPTTGALGSSVITLPAATSTAVVAATSTTTTQVLHASATAGVGTYADIAAGDLPTVTIAKGGLNATSAASAGLVPNTSSTTASAWTATPSLGVAGSVVGTLGFANATSGSITLQPTTGALGTTVLTLPATSGTLAKTSDNISGTAAGLSATLAEAQFPALDGDVTTTAGDLTTALAARYKVRTCEIVIGDPGAASAALANDNDSPAVCGNLTGSTMTITEVKCYADSSTGSPSVLPIITGGAADSILTGAIACGNAAFGSAGTLNGTPTQSDGASIDANISVAGGTAKYIIIRVKRTL